MILRILNGRRGQEGHGRLGPLPEMVEGDGHSIGWGLCGIVCG